jgi:hypothetical protein
MPTEEELKMQKEAEDKAKAEAGKNEDGKSKESSQDMAKFSEILTSLVAKVDGLEANQTDFVKKTNSELADRRKSIEGVQKVIEDELKKLTASNSEGQNNQKIVELEQMKADTERLKRSERELTTQIAVERKARALNFAHEEDVIRFIAPDKLAAILDDKGKVDEKALEEALKETAERYPALIGTTSKPDLDDKTPASKNKEEARKKSLEGRFGVKVS